MTLQPIFVALVFFLSGVIATYAWTEWRDRRKTRRLLQALRDDTVGFKTPAAAAGPVADAPADQDDAVGQILQLAAALKDDLENGPHPRILLLNEGFLRGARLLASGKFQIDALLGYIVGEQPALACMSLYALELRDDFAGADALLAQTRDSYAWKLYFLLRTAHKKSAAPVLGRALLELQAWWSENGLYREIVSEFAREEARRAGGPGFQGALLQAPLDRIEAAEKMLRALALPELQPLLNEIDEFRRVRVDRSFLSSIGRIWGADDFSVPVFTHPAHAAALQQIQACYSPGSPRPALISGPPGCGKTSLIRGVARELAARGWTIFEATASDVQAGQQYIGQIEERVQQLLRHLSAERKVLWYVPNFQDLAHAAKHRYNPVSLLDMLLPALESGSIVAIGEITDSAEERLLQERPRVRTIAERIRLKPLEDAETLELGRTWAAALPTPNLLSDAVLREALQYSKQYLGERQQPGALFDFLKITLNRKQSGKSPTPVASDDLLQTLAQLTGLPAEILDDRQSLNIDELRRRFYARVIGQTEAVECLVERVAMIKAGLTDAARPYGVFLFVGPTGSGKTEIARALAEFLFGAPERMIRLDMSEFQTPDSLDRLVGDGEPGRSDALVNQIRKQPFSVVLLDEFEKANPNVYDLFLQVFDDGRLTDKRGVTADFRHAIIILTSNLGAAIARGPGIGFGSEGAQFSSGGVERAVNAAFRREFINRIDRVVVFRPLSRGVMRDILHKELELALARRGFRSRGWETEWDDSAVEFLLERGFTVDLGARPLRRAIERYLLSPLALTMVNHQAPSGRQFLFVRGGAEKLHVDFVDPDAADAIGDSELPEADELADGQNLRRVLLQATGTREELDLLESGLARLEEWTQTDDWRREKLERMSDAGAGDFWERPDRYRILGRIELMDRVENALQTARSLARRLAGEPDRRNHRAAQRHSPDLARRLARLLYLLEETRLSLNENLPPDALLVIDFEAGAPDDEIRRQLPEMYHNWAEARRMRFDLLIDERARETGALRYACALSGFGCFRILRPESGWHIFELGGGDRSVLRQRARVRVLAQSEIPDPDRAIARKTIQELPTLSDETGGAEPVRRYRLSPSPLVRDSVRNYRSGRLDRILAGDFDLFGE